MRRWHWHTLLEGFPKRHETGIVTRLPPDEHDWPRVLEVRRAPVGLGWLWCLVSGADTILKYGYRPTQYGARMAAERMMQKMGIRP